MPNLIGKSGVLVHTVMPTDLATQWKNQLPVLATPILLWLAELATIKAVEGALAPDSMTVGIGHHNRHLAPGVRIVVASADFPEKSYRGRKEIGRGVLSNRTKSRIAQDVATSA